MALTIRPTEEMKKNIEKLKELYGFKSASKVIEFVLNNYLELKEDSDKYKTKIYNLENDLARIKGIIKRKKKVEDEYSEMINQID